MQSNQSNQPVFGNIDVDGSSKADALAAPARAAQPQDGRREATVEGTPSTNRVPNNSIDYFMPLRWGVDSLYFSYPGRLRTEVIETLSRLKQLAQSEEGNEQSLAQYPIGDHTFEVQDRAVRGYAFVLEDGAFRITLTRGKQRPQLVKVSAGYLAFSSPQEVGKDVDRILAELIEMDGPANVTAIRVGTSVVFDRLDLDRVLEEHMQRNGRPVQKGGNTWAETRPASIVISKAIGGLIRSIPALDFATVSKRLKKPKAG